VVTTAEKIMVNDCRVYVKTEGNNFFGFIKVGPKHLFYHDYTGQIIEMTALCVLDFYVYEKLQRSGYGRKIFDKMLSEERISPAKLAYDRPSTNLYPFLKKHYNLVDFIPQNNNFVIFRNYFTTPSATSYNKPFLAEPKVELPYANKTEEEKNTKQTTAY